MVDVGPTQPPAAYVMFRWRDRFRDCPRLIVPDAGTTLSQGTSDDAVQGTWLKGGLRIPVMVTH